MATVATTAFAAASVLAVAVVAFAAASVLAVAAVRWWVDVRNPYLPVSTLLTEPVWQLAIPDTPIGREHRGDRYWAPNGYFGSVVERYFSSDRSRVELREVYSTFMTRSGWRLMSADSSGRRWCKGLKGVELTWIDGRDPFEHAPEAPREAVTVYKLVVRSTETEVRSCAP